MYQQQRPRREIEVDILTMFYIMSDGRVHQGRTLIGVNTHEVNKLDARKGLNKSNVCSIYLFSRRV